MIEKKRYNYGYNLLAVPMLLSLFISQSLNFIDSYVITLQKSALKHIKCPSSRHSNLRNQLSLCTSNYQRSHVSTSLVANERNVPSAVSQLANGSISTLLIHWRGEDVEGYSLQFRHIEYVSAIAAELDLDNDEKEDALSKISFANALKYNGLKLVNPLKINGYNQALQYMYKPDAISISTCIRAAKRCSLIHAIYGISAVTDSYESSTGSYDALAAVALEHNAFADLRIGETNENQSWCLRVRHYGNNTINESDNESMLISKERRYGERARSLTLERRALSALTPLLRHFGGKVNLHKPDCKIYVFDGLLPQTMPSNLMDSTNIDLIPTKLVLARRIGTGARQQVYSIHPTSRICITNTPLCPMTSFIMANIARTRWPYNNSDGFAILDPYCGSAGILLAAAMILQTSKEMRSPSSAPSPLVKLVGIEICHDGIVNRDHVMQDFISRNWTDPVVLLHGDSTHSDVRRRALDTIGDHRPYDAIITDPPYGIRESNQGRSRPIIDLLQMIVDDRNAGVPLLRIGGRLVVFVPHRVEDEKFEDIIPNEEQMRAAGLICEFYNKQYLNDQLNRWLVSYVCIR